MTVILAILRSRMAKSRQHWQLHNETTTYWLCPSSKWTPQWTKV